MCYVSECGSVFTCACVSVLPCVCVVVVRWHPGGSVMGGV